MNIFQGHQEEAHAKAQRRKEEVGKDESLLSLRLCASA
jgi:hypothetical protein